MTSNQIAYKEAKTKEEGLKETKRSNRAKEKLEKSAQDLTRRGQNIQAGTNAVKAIGGILGSHCKGNDPAWYNAEPQLVKDVASLSFNTPLGSSFDTMHRRDDLNKGMGPGLMVLRFMPTLGALSIDGKASTADIAAKSIYSYVRYANSGARNYEASDLMMYLLAVTEAYSYYGYLARVYSFLTTSKSHNRYYVNGTLIASGVNPTDLRNNIANFRAYINSYATRLNSLYIPKDLPYMIRHMWMNTKVFKDAPIKKSQEYMYLQKDFLKYDDKNGKLVVFPEGITEQSYKDYAYDFKPKAGFTFAQLKNTGDLIINQLVQSEDAGIMGGDILKAYGESNMAYATMIPEDYHIESEYSYEVLTQIHNAMFTGTPKTGFTDADKLHLYDISQTTINMVDYLTQGRPYYNTSEDAIAETNVVGYGFPATMGLTQPHFVANPINSNNVLLNFDMDNVTPDDVMVATRMMFVLDDTKYFTINRGSTSLGSIQTGCVTKFGSEISIDYYVLVIDYATGEIQVPDTYASFLDTDNIGYFIDNMSVILCFDWHPRLYVLGANNSTSILGFSDLANYTTLANSVQENLHYVAVLSEFGIPKLGLTVRTR